VSDAYKFANSKRHRLSHCGQEIGQGNAARQKVFDAHTKYCKEIPQNASALLKDVSRIWREAGMWAGQCIKRMSTLPIAVLANTVSTFP
jgi:uncharacterized protein Yka (UPF0111/DUF47 family)